MKTINSESKDNDERFTVGADYKGLWEKVFHDPEECKHHWNGICGKKMIAKIRADQDRGIRKLDYNGVECNFPCPEFEKGENLTAEIRRMKREFRRLGYS